MSEELTLLPCPACVNTDAVVSVTTRAAVYCPMWVCAGLAPQRSTWNMRSGNGIPSPARWSGRTSRRRCRGGTGSRMNMASASHGSSMTLVK